MNLSDSKKKLALAGVVCGIVAAVLAAMGNPANMAICIACFVRDTAGALKLHSASAVQYARPEIVGIVVGAFAISAATKEYRSTGGSSPLIRFVLGMIIMIGSLAFLGCPLRMVIRMSAGDLWRKRGTNRPILTSVIPSGGSGEKSNKKIVQHAEKKKIIFEKI